MYTSLDCKQFFSQFLCSLVFARLICTVYSTLKLVDARRTKVCIITVQTNWTMCPPLLLSGDMSQKIHNRLSTNVQLYSQTQTATRATLSGGKVRASCTPTLHIQKMRVMVKCRCADVRICRCTVSKVQIMAVLPKRLTIIMVRSREFLTKKTIAGLYR